MPFDYYTDLPARFKAHPPRHPPQCASQTAVEISFFADLYTMSDEQVCAS